MSTYFTELQSAKLTALRELVAALAAADSPAEKRRCATAILKLPDPKPDAQAPARPEVTVPMCDAALPAVPSGRAAPQIAEPSPVPRMIESRKGETSRPRAQTPFESSHAQSSSTPAPVSTSRHRPADIPSPPLASPLSPVPVLSSPASPAALLRASTGAPRGLSPIVPLADAPFRPLAA